MIRLTPTMPLSASVPLRLAAKMPLLTPTSRKIDGSAQGDRQRGGEPLEQVVGDVDPQLEGDPEAGRVALDVIAPAWKSLPTKMPFMYSPYCSTTGSVEPERSW